MTPLELPQLKICDAHVHVAPSRVSGPSIHVTALKKATDSLTLQEP